jgi:hypothetical protein
MATNKPFLIADNTYFIRKDPRDGSLQQQRALMDAGLRYRPDDGLTNDIYRQANQGPGDVARYSLVDPNSICIFDYETDDPSSAAAAALEKQFLIAFASTRAINPRLRVGPFGVPFYGKGRADILLGKTCWAADFLCVQSYIWSGDRSGWLDALQYAAPRAIALADSIGSHGLARPSVIAYLNVPPRPNVVDNSMVDGDTMTYMLQQCHWANLDGVSVWGYYSLLPFDPTFGWYQALLSARA